MNVAAARFAALFSFCAVLALGSFARAEIDVQGFQAWKTAKVEEAKSNLEKIQAAKDAPAAKAAPSAKLSRTEQLSAVGLTNAPQKSQRLQQSQTSLAVAQELSVNDYFVLYLSQFKNNREAFIEAAKKLSPEEAADLMMSYQKHLTGAAELDEPTTVSQTK